jgi:thioredoxin-dependent peroxiredoxin
MNINYDITMDTLNFDNFPSPILTGNDVFSKQRVVVFGLPGAFTPTCSTQQVPGYSDNYHEIRAKGVDEIYCTSVNDGFVMKAWFENFDNYCRVKYLADGNGQFARRMGMLVDKNNLGFGARSWRYAAVINNGVIEIFLPEMGMCDDCHNDPYEESTPENLLSKL